MRCSTWVCGRSRDHSQGRPSRTPTAVFSATMPPVAAIAQRHLHAIPGASPLLAKKPPENTARTADAYIVARAQGAALGRARDRTSKPDRLHRTRGSGPAHGHAVGVNIAPRRCGGMVQRDRDKVMNGFRDGDVELCRPDVARVVSTSSISHTCSATCRHRPKATCTASADGARRPHWRRHYIRRTSRASPAAEHRGVHETIDIATFPVADLHTQRLDMTRAALRSCCWPRLRRRAGGRRITDAGI